MRQSRNCIRLCDSHALLYRLSQSVNAAVSIYWYRPGASMSTPWLLLLIATISTQRQGRFSCMVNVNAPVTALVEDRNPVVTNCCYNPYGNAATPRQRARRREPSMHSESITPLFMRRPQPSSRLRRELFPLSQALLPRLRGANLLARLLPPYTLNTVRAAIYRLIGFDVGPRVSFLSDIQVIGSGHAIYGRLHVGADSLIGYKPTFNLDDTITIGRNVAFGPFVSIFTSTHLLGPGSRRMSPGIITRPVVIEDGAWIGIGTIILPGVVVGRGSVVGAGSIVTESVPPNALVSGNPAKSIQELPLPDE